MALMRVVAWVGLEGGQWPADGRYRSTAERHTIGRGTGHDSLGFRRHNHVVGVIDSILENPSAWTGERVLGELPVRMHDDPRRGDPSLPRWLRAVIVLCDFETHVQMEGLLGWWENAASNDLGNVMEAFQAIGLSGQSKLLGNARQVLDPRAFDSDPPQALHSVSSFADRRGWVTEEQYTRFAQIEERLYLNAEDAPDLYAALVAHANAGLAATRQPRRL